MVGIPLGKSDWLRTVSDEPEIPVLNRFFETNPTSIEDGVAMLSRPGLKRYLEVGAGPIRTLYSQTGSFSDALFVVSGEGLYKVATDETVTELGLGITGDGTENFNPSMAATGSIGSTPEYLYLADGRILWLYTENANARGRLEVGGTIANGHTIQLNGSYYSWTTGPVDTGVPDGTSGAPWLVALGTGNATALDNMRDAINDMGIPGTTYNTGLTANETVYALRTTADSLAVQYYIPGTEGNVVSVTVTVGGTQMAWANPTLTGGGAPLFTQVAVPDDAGVVSVGFISGYIIVVINQGYGVNGRFYWIEPGSTIIDPLNFATAERSPDPLLSVRVVGDQFWLLGTNSTEVWYASGIAETPFLRVQGRLFDRGVWEGTDIQIKDVVVLVDANGVVNVIGEGGPQRISNNSIEQRIREAMQVQRRSFG